MPTSFTSRYPLLNAIGWLLAAIFHRVRIIPANDPPVTHEIPSTHLTSTEKRTSGQHRLAQ